jgi:endogenous inhibitor of DNA gyrase (YacG/DUF329 family)
MFFKSKHSNGFYFRYDHINGYNECIKVFESGNVKRIIYTDEIKEIVDKLFYIENMPCDFGFINSDIFGQKYIQFNSINGPIIYYYNTSTDNSIIFNINYPNGKYQTLSYMFYKIQDHLLEEEYEVSCDSCKNKFKITPSEDFDAFICRKCRSIYTYEWLNGELKIVQQIKNAYIPPEIKRLLTFFNYDRIEIDKTVIKSKYKELISLNHPDKFATVAQEYKDMAENKTKEINLNYEILENWLKNNGY